MGLAKTIRTGKLGKLELRVVLKDGIFHGLAGGKPLVQCANADDAWNNLIEEAGKTNSNYFGFDGALARFLHWFPAGFQSSAFLADERKYKIDAKVKLDATAPLENAATGSGFGEAVWSVYQTNLLSPFEKMRVRDLLRSSAADEFIRAAARFALGEGKPALLEMERASKLHSCAKWTVVSYLPFLWRPGDHMFLKPEATTEFASRVGHRFAQEYQPGLNFAVYESLLDLASRTEKKLADLMPRDRIDVQSLIWVVGDYKEGRETPKT